MRGRCLTPEAKFALIFKGKSVQDDETAYTFEAKAIVHLINLERIGGQTLNLTFKVHGDSKEVISVRTTPQTLIRDVLRN